MANGPAVAGNHTRMSDRVKGVAILTIVLIITGFASVAPAQEPAASIPAYAPAPSSRQVDASFATRLQAVMVPLLQNMNRPIPLNRVEIGLMDDHHINAANAGGGHFYVTTGLLEKANDDQLRAVMAHEMGHADLGHVAKLQRLGTGLSIGAILLDQIIPGSGALTPIAGQIIANAYT